MYAPMMDSSGAPRVCSTLERKIYASELSYEN